MKPKVFYSLPCPECETSTEPTDVRHRPDGCYKATFRCTGDECESVTWTHRFPYSYDQIPHDGKEEEAPKEPTEVKPFQGSPLKWSDEDRDRFIEVNGREAYLKEIEQWQRQASTQKAAEQ